MLDPKQDQHNLFSPSARASPRNWIAIAAGLALVAIVIVLAVLFTAKGPPPPAAISAPAAYAPQLPLTAIKMSTADLGTGAQIYYITGTVTNTGPKTVTGATVELLFRDSLGKLCQRETVPLRVVIATEPALDATGLDHAPLSPGQSRDFQLPLEHISAQWDGQYPALTLVQVTTK